MATSLPGPSSSKETDSLLGCKWKSTGKSVTPVRGKDGYDRRRQTQRQGSFPSDYGTYLSVQDPTATGGRRRNEPGSAHIQIEPDCFVSTALHNCRKHILRTFERMLRLVGFKRIFDSPNSCCQKVVNYLHPIIVVSMILASFAIQYSACWIKPSYDDGEASTATTTTPPPSDPLCGYSSVSGQWPSCQRHVYIIPYLLHMLAYGYSFYVLRMCDSEQLSTLMERVFLNTSLMQSGSLSQTKLIKNMRCFFLLGLAWVIFSLASQILVVIHDYQVNFLHSNPGQPDIPKVWVICLCGVTVLGFLALDLVYTVVVIDYCVQCSLIIFYIRGLRDKIRQKAFTLLEAMKEIYRVEKHLQTLNRDTATALAIVLINMVSMILLELPNFNRDLTTPAWVIGVCLWTSIILFSVIQAARLTANCNSLRKLGHEISVRPFAYKDTPDTQLNTFLLFSSSLNMRAKICRIPIKTSYLCGVLIAATVTVLALMQVLWQLGP